jgi:DNA-binding transcriptional LysR family regulator
VLAYGLYADGRYLAGRSAPRRVAELAKHDWVGFSPPLDRLPVNRWLAAQTGRPPVLSASAFGALLAAARAGVGVAALPELSASGLVPVLPGCALPELPVWIVTHRDAGRQPHIAAFVENLRAQLAPDAGPGVR